MSNAETASTSDYRQFVKLNHCNYHEWEPHACAELMKAGVWRFCTGDELAPVHPTDPGSLPTTTTGDARDKWMKLSKDYNEELRHHNEHYCCNDRAVGIICLLIEADQFEYIKDKTTAKDVWDTLKAKHANINTGLAAFYTKIGMLEKKYTDGEDIHAHFNFIIMENHKLGKKAFDDEFLAQVLLMSLPRDSVTWETLTVALLQAATDTTPLKSDDVMRRCMVQHQRLNGTDSPASALAASRSSSKGKAGQAAKQKKKCNFCKYLGHTEDECQKKKAQEANRTSGSTDGNKGKGKPKANVASTSEGSSQDEETVQASLTSILHEFPSSSVSTEDDGLHVFLAGNSPFFSHTPDITALLARSSKDDTFIDSGCSRHLTPRRDWFRDDTFKSLERPINIHLGDASVIKAEGVGTLQYLMDTPSGVIPGSVPDVLYVPALATTLLSVSRFTGRNHDVRFEGNNCFIIAKPSGHCVAQAIKTPGGLYSLQARPTPGKEPSRSR